MLWAGIVDDTLVGPFRVLEGVKKNSENYISFLTDHFVNWCHSIDRTARDELVFMQDNAPNHASKKTKTFLQANGCFGKKASGLASIIV